MSFGFPPLALEFQPTLPQGERRYCDRRSMFVQTFQPTLPQGERRTRKHEDYCRRKFQPTLPQGERPCHECIEIRLQHISTHAPARGATAKTYNAKSFLTITQGTLHKTEQQMYRYKILSLKSALVFNKNAARIPAPFNGHLSFAHQQISGPAKSTPCFFPICSIRFLYCSPRT